MLIPNITFIFENNEAFPEKNQFYCRMLIQGYFHWPSLGDISKLLQILKGIQSCAKLLFQSELCKKSDLRSSFRVKAPKNRPKSRFWGPFDPRSEEEEILNQ